MSRINVNRFLGIAPKIAAHLLSNDQAQLARNTRPWSGALRPLLGLATGTALAKTTGTIQTLHRYAVGNWLAWTEDVNAVLAPIANDTLEKLYFTGTDKPRVTTNVLWDDGAPGTSVPPASWILGIPAPVGPPVATIGAAGNITGANLTWVYTFVRKYSDGWVEESAPSPISNAVSPAAQQVSVTLPNGAIVTADYGITHKRLYRLNGANFFFVAEVVIGTSPQIDNVATIGLGDAILTTRDLPAPDGLKGMIALANNCLAGYKDNSVYLSEPKRPHAYPLLNQYAVAFPIVGLASIGNTIVVITTGQPEIGRGVDPAAYSFRKMAGKFPCTSKRSIASSDIGVLWSTPRGMAICDGVTVSMATAEFMTKDEWADFKPTTIHGLVHQGRYYGWFETGVDVDGTKIGGGFILDRTEPAFLVKMLDYVYAAHATHDGDDLFVVKREPAFSLNNYVYAWEGDPTAPFAYEWKSKEYITPGAENLGFAQVIAKYGQGLTAAQIAALQAEIAAVAAFNAALTELDGAINDLAFDEDEINGDTVLLEAPSSTYVPGVVSFSYWGDGVLLFEGSCESNVPFPLPSGFLAEVHEFQIAGAVEVHQVTLAGSLEEIGAR